MISTTAQPGAPAGRPAGGKLHIHPARQTDSKEH